MDAVKFVQASKFVVTAVDKAGVLADLRAALKRNDMRLLYFSPEKCPAASTGVLPKAQLFWQKNVPSGWSLCHDEWIANSW